MSIQPKRHPLTLGLLLLLHAPLAAHAADVSPAPAPAPNATPDPVQLDTITVTGAIVSGERQALQAQREAVNLLNVVSADGMGKLPDHNAAEAVQRVPGVSIERDQGEGRFVAVRGLPAQWSSTTLNGDRLPTAEEETTSRATAFDFFPTELIERIEVSKTLTPDREGDAIGGQVNFVTRTAPSERTVSASFAPNYNDKAGDTGYNANLLYGDRSEDGRFGFMINGMYWKRPWATDNFEPRRGADGKGVYRLELRDYTGERITRGVNGGMEFQPSPGNTLYLRGQYGELSDDETHYKHRYRFDRDRVEVQNIHNELITEFKNFEIGGRHTLGQGELGWKLAQAENQFSYGCIPTCQDNAYFVVQFNQGGVGYQGLENRGSGANSYNEIDGGRTPGSSPDTHLPDGFRMDPSKTKLSTVELYRVFVDEKDKAVAQLDYDFDASSSLRLKFGAKYRDKERRARFSDEFYAWNTSTGGLVPTLADFALIDQPGRNGYDIGGSGDYSADFSKVVPVDVLSEWYRRNKGNLVLVPGDSALISNGAALGRNFDVAEKQYAAYGMGTWQPDALWTVVGGVRVERTETDVRGQVLEEGADGQSELRPSLGRKRYTSVLPQLNVRWSIQPDLNLRLGLTRSFARPDFGDINPGGSYMEADGTFTSGNADLDPTYSDNLDLMVEWYAGPLGLISAGAFYKSISNPVFESSSTGTFNGNSNVTFYRPENGDDAKLWGAELAFVRRFDFLPGWLGNFGVNANLTLMDSRMRIPGRADDVPITGQADRLYNVTLYYDDGAFAARLATNHKGAYIESHGSSPDSDAWYGKNTTVDFSTSYTFDRWTVFAELSNLTDEPLTYYQGSPQRPLQMEYYGRRAQIGLKYQF
jgi:TonB-dependent receptor